MTKNSLLSQHGSARKNTVKYCSEVTEQTEQWLNASVNQCQSGFTEDTFCEVEGFDGTAGMKSD